jgi:hypothetical protein
MNRVGRKHEATDREMHYLPARSWAACANNFMAQVSQTMGVIKGGGLRQPGIAEHLQASRISASFSHTPES